MNLNRTREMPRAFYRMVRKWGSFVRFSHTIFALPFALAAMMVAAGENRGWPGWKTFLLILLAMICARTCAMSFNRIVDRKFDALNPRTRDRHLPAGHITPGSAIGLCVASSAGLVVAAYFLNPVCLFLSPVALGVICFYSLTKRFTDFTHVFLGIALALAPIGSWLAVKGSLGFPPIRGMFASTAALEAWLAAARTALEPIVLALAVVFWLTGFDIIYALQDHEFDKAHGLRSLVVAWGPKNALDAAFLAHVFTCGFLYLFGVFCGFRIVYLAGLLIIAGCLLLEHWIARRRSLAWINLAFFRLNAVISAVFLAVTAAEVIFAGGFKFR